MDSIRPQPRDVEALQRLRDAIEARRSESEAWYQAAIDMLDEIRRDMAAHIVAQERATSLDRVLPGGAR